MKRHAAIGFILSLTCLLLMAREAQSSCNIIRNGKTVATHTGITFYRGDKELGTFDGIYVKKKGVTVGKYEGVHLKKKGVTIGYIDGDLVKSADGRVLFTILSDGKVIKNGKLYLKFNYYSGIFDIRYLIGVYLFFFDS